MLIPKFGTYLFVNQAPICSPHLQKTKQTSKMKLKNPHTNTKQHYFLCPIVRDLYTSYLKLVNILTEIRELLHLCMVVLKWWSLGLQHQITWELCWKCRFSGSPQTYRIRRWALATCVCTSLPGDSDAC